MLLSGGYGTSLEEAVGRSEAVVSLAMSSVALSCGSIGAAVVVGAAG